MQLGHLHVAIVHFPIALVLAAAAADLLWWLTKRPLFKNAGLYCLMAALIATPAVLVTGSLLADEVFSPTTAPSILDRVEDHEHAAIASFGIMVAAGVVRWLWAKNPGTWQPVLYGLTMAALVLCIAITGALGGELVYGSDWFAKLF
jgi:uncharacterized membrane protein